jgi:hypothetical protein
MKEMNLTDTLGYRQHPAISNSDLKYLYNPKLFKLNKEKQLEQEPTEAQEDGNLIDMYLLEREKFNEITHIVDKPISTPNSPNKESFCKLVFEGMDPQEAYLLSYKVSKKDMESGAYVTNASDLYNELKEYIELKTIAQTKKIIYPDVIAMLSEIELAVANHSLANRFINAPDKGWEIVSQLVITDVDFMLVKWKGKLDRVIIDHMNQIIYNIELKSTRGQQYFTWDYKKYKYYRQQALYELLLQDKYKHLIEKGYVIKTRVIAVEKSFPYDVRVIAVPHHVLKAGIDELVDAAAIISWHQHDQKWDKTISYYVNNGLEVIDWEQFDVETD